MSESSQTSAVVAWVWSGLIAAGAVAVLIGILAQGILDVDTVVLLGASITYTGLGLLIVIRAPGNRIAWLFLVVATWIVSSGASIVFIGEFDSRPSRIDALELIGIMFSNVGYFIGLMIPIALFFYLFPDGRFMSRRWSWAGWVAVVISIIAVLSQVAPTEVAYTDSDGNVLWTVQNPVGFVEGLEWSGGLTEAVFGIGFMAIALIAIPALLVRYMRSDGAVRSQIKWVVYAGVIVGTGFIVSVFFGDAVPGWLSDLGFYMLVTVFPVSLAVAITRHRLYEIDRIFSRTVAYLLVVGLLGLVYLIGAVWLPTRLLGEQPPLFVAATTLGIAALFNPLRRTILTVVDRRFNRARYDSARVLDEFTSDLANASDVEQLARESLDVVSRTMQPATAGIWIRSD